MTGAVMSDSPSGSAPRVLLVDDDDALREAIRAMLEDQGVPVVGEAGTGAEAIELARRLHPDVAVIDFRMPGMDGVEVTASIREVSPATRVVMLTAFDESSLVSDAIRAGVFDFLPKGSPPYLLTEAIHRAGRHSVLDRPIER